MESFFLEHIRDLSARSAAQDIFTFTEFLNPEEQSALLRIGKELNTLSFFGGAEGAERKVARFGDPDLLGYEAEFPIVCMKIAPRNQKFADKLTHRDFLGTLMGTGIERGRIGDIVVKNNEAFVFVLDPISQYLAETVTSVKHTAVVCSPCENLPDGALYETKPYNGIAASRRLDCIVGAVYHDSRSAAQTLISSKKVFVNGAVTENASYLLKPGDVISVRGEGKFRFKEVTGETKKGRIAFLAEIYQ